jgi:acyl carrier protein
MNERIKKVMAKVFKTPIESITNQSNMDNTENWDSIHHVQMIVFLEREFDIIIPDEEVGNMISFKLIETEINKCYESTSANN